MFPFKTLFQLQPFETPDQDFTEAHLPPGFHRKKNAERVQLIRHDSSPYYVPGAGFKAEVKKIKNP